MEDESKKMKATSWPSPDHFLTKISGASFVEQPTSTPDRGDLARNGVKWKKRPAFVSRHTRPDLEVTTPTQTILITCTGKDEV